MAVLDDNLILEILKTDLQISVSNYDGYLKNLIDLSKAAIKGEGIKLDESESEHGMVVEMYASYLYRKRREEQAVMPRYLRYLLNNLLLSQKGSV